MVAGAGDGDDDDEGDDIEELGSDDDDADDAEPETENSIQCQFDRVSRSKNRWKAQLRDGIMRINGRDYCFKSATGEMTWL